MKIGIITFHWATNYGAILQAFALQHTLQNMGHDVDIINYKPSQYDPSLWKFIRRRQFLHLNRYFSDRKKERQMTSFRTCFLHCTPRYASVRQLRDANFEYDVLISGSDQVMNPFFLAHGEKGGSTAYFLDFGPQSSKRITYAMSFGTTVYPEHLLPIASPLIQRFHTLSVRETTGKAIFASMGRTDAVLVPDPTLLLCAKDYHPIVNLTPSSSNYTTLIYMLHNRLSTIQAQIPKDAKIITSETIGQWLQAIQNSQYVVTNSFHGMIFCLLYHTPFSIVLPNTRNEGMNDRFFSLLNRLNLQDRIMTEQNYRIDHTPINWTDIDRQIDQIRQTGLDFLTRALN